MISPSLASGLELAPFCAETIAAIYNPLSTSIQARINRESFAEPPSHRNTEQASQSDGNEQPERHVCSLKRVSGCPQFGFRQFQGSSSSIRLTGCSAMRARTSASQACGSTSLSWAVWFSEWSTAARCPPRSEPPNSHAFRPSGTQRSARSAALFVRQIRPSSRKRMKAPAPEHVVYRLGQIVAA